jgi:hypothetical protein
MPPLVPGTASQNAPRRRLVDLIGASHVIFIRREQMRLEHTVHTYEALHRLPRLLGFLDRIEARDECGVCGLRDLSLGAQLRQAPPERVGVLSVVPT